MARRKTKKQRKRAALPIIVLAVVVGAALLLAVFWKVKTITVVGESRYSDREIALASGIESGDNFLLFLTSNRERAVWTSLVYIDGVEISRKLFSEVVITVTAAEPLIAVQTETGYALISEKRKVLEVLKEPPPQCALVLGYSDTEQTAGAQFAPTNAAGFATVMEIVDGLCVGGDIYKTNLIDVTDPLRIQLVYDERILVKLGTSSGIQAKLDLFRTAIRQEVNLRLRGCVNVSYAAYATVYEDDNAINELYPEYFNN